MTTEPLPAVRVVARGRGHAVHAGRLFRADETILEARGVVLDAPTRHSLQIGKDAHLAPPPRAALGEYAWRFLNHACRPNAAFYRRRLVALRRIEKGEQITFDYETTEWDLAEPFACTCGAADCERRQVRGFRHLSSEERRIRFPQLREELRGLVDQAPPLGAHRT